MSTRIFAWPKPFALTLVIVAEVATETAEGRNRTILEQIIKITVTGHTPMETPRIWMYLEEHTTLRTHSTEEQD